MRLDNRTIIFSHAEVIGRTIKYPQAWMSIRELTWLITQARNHETVVEIGCWKGRTTRALADNILGMVYAVDPWASPLWDEEGIERTGDEIFAIFKKNLFDFPSGTVIPLRMPSVKAAEHCRQQGLTFGMIFIDGSHHYEDVRDDILAWRPLLAPDGLLCGHDYHVKGPGVRRAVEELVPNFGVLDGQADGTPNEICSIWYEIKES